MLAGLMYVKAVGLTVVMAVEEEEKEKEKEREMRLVWK